MVELNPALAEQFIRIYARDGEISYEECNNLDVEYRACDSIISALSGDGIVSREEENEFFNSGIPYEFVLAITGSDGKEAKQRRASHLSATRMLDELSGATDTPCGWDEGAATQRCRRRRENRIAAATKRIRQAILSRSNDDFMKAELILGTARTLDANYGGFMTGGFWKKVELSGEAKAYLADSLIAAAKGGQFQAMPFSFCFYPLAEALFDGEYPFTGRLLDSLANDVDTSLSLPILAAALERGVAPAPVADGIIRSLSEKIEHYDRNYIHHIDSLLGRTVHRENPFRWKYEERDPALTRRLLPSIIKSQSVDLIGTVAFLTKDAGLEAAALGALTDIVRGADFANGDMEVRDAIGALSMFALRKEGASEEAVIKIVSALTAKLREPGSLLNEPARCEKNYHDCYLLDSVGLALGMIYKSPGASEEAKALIIGELEAAGKARGVSLEFTETGEAMYARSYSMEMGMDVPAGASTARLAIRTDDLWGEEGSNTWPQGSAAVTPGAGMVEFPEVSLDRRNFASRAYVTFDGSGEGRRFFYIVNPDFDYSGHGYYQELKARSNAYFEYSQL